VSSSVLFIVLASALYPTDETTRMLFSTVSFFKIKLPSFFVVVPIVVPDK